MFQEISNNSGQKCIAALEIFVILTEARSVCLSSSCGRCDAAVEELLIFTEVPNTFSFSSVFCRFKGYGYGSSTTENPDESRLIPLGPGVGGPESLETCTTSCLDFTGAGFRS
jgi:hypothetical protein